MRHLKACGHRVMPWKNGLGSTTEIAVYPPGAGIEKHQAYSFQWYSLAALAVVLGLVFSFRKKIAHPAQ